MQRNHYLLNNIILPYIQHHRLLSTTRAIHKASVNTEFGSSFAGGSYPTWSALPPGSGRSAEEGRRELDAAESSSRGQAWLRVLDDAQAPAKASTDDSSNYRRSPAHSSSHPLPTAKRKVQPNDPPDKTAHVPLPQASPPEEQRSKYQETVHQAITMLVDIHTRPSIPYAPSLPLRPDADVQSTSNALSTSDTASTSSSPLPKDKDKANPPVLTTRPTVHPIPPLIHNLLKARQFRLAVFHMLNTPQLAWNNEVLLLVAEDLERNKAGKLGARLRRTISENARGACLTEQGQGGDGTKGRKLAADVRAPGSSRRWDGFFDLTLIPPSIEDGLLEQHVAAESEAKAKASPSQTPTVQTSHELFRRRKITTHFNNHLAYLLRNSSPSSSRTLTPHLALSQSPKSPGATLPPPRPNLAQLRALLHSIQSLQRKYHFLPDRRTANLILECWLRCAQPPSHRSDRFRVVQTNDEEWLTEKTPAKGRRVFRPEEIMALFGIVAGSMEKAVEEVEERFKRVVRGMWKDETGRWMVRPDQVGALGSSSSSSAASANAASDAKSNDHKRTGNTQTHAKAKTSNPTSPQSNSSIPIPALERLSRRDEGDIDYTLHIRPFTEMVLRNLSRVEGYEERARVISWKKEMRDRMELVRLGRVRVRRKLGLAVGGCR